MISQQFRPSLIICVGKAGERIRTNLVSDMLPIYLEKALHPGVMVLQVTTGASNADPNATPFPIGDVAGDPDTPTRPGPLREVFHRSLISVQLDRRRLAALHAGYAVPDSRTQIFIVGETDGNNALLMAKALRIVCEEVRRYQLDLPIYYVLNSYQPQADHADALRLPLGAGGLNWSHYEIARFSYLYEHLITYPLPVFLSEDEVRYATEQALLGMAVTGISSIPNFENEMRLPVNLVDYSTRVGSLSTSIIMFPRLAALRYCSAQLSAALLQRWSTDLHNTNVSDDERQRMYDKAAQTVRNMATWMRDSMPRPGVEDHLAPSLAILRQGGQTQLARQIELRRQLDDSSKDLFRAFSHRGISHEYKRVRKTLTWGALTSRSFGKAAGHHARWEVQAKNAWDIATGRAGDEIKQILDDIWPVSHNGFEMARMYVVALDNRLTGLVDEVTRWRQRHDTVYRDELIELEQVASAGEWILDLNEPNIQGTQVPLQQSQVKPSMGGQGPVISLNAQTGKQSPAGTNVAALLHTIQPTSSPQRLPKHEEEIALNLGRRADWKQKQIPPIPALVAPGIFICTIIALYLSVSALPLVFQIGIDLLAGVLCVISSAIVYLLRQRDVTDAREDLLEFYTLYYAHECQRREDLLRISLLQTLGGRVQKMRDRIETMDSFLSRESSNASQRADTINKELFTGPSGTRDIFIAKGERLQQHGRHTLNTIAGHITQNRLNHPKQAWHRTLDDIRTELLRMFHTQPESLIEMGEVRVVERINGFVEGIIRDYLNDKELVDISLALDKEEIWREVLDHVRKPLYSAKAGLREPQFLFICGSANEMARLNRIRTQLKIPPDAITVQTHSSEWLLVMGFFRGGEPTALNAKELFLPKSPPPAGGSASGSGAPYGGRWAPQPGAGYHGPGMDGGQPGNVPSKTGSLTNPLPQLPPAGTRSTVRGAPAGGGWSPQSGVQNYTPEMGQTQRGIVPGTDDDPTGPLPAPNPVNKPTSEDDTTDRLPPRKRSKKRP